MCTVKMNKELLYQRLQEINYQLDLLYESPEENQDNIFEFENKRAKLEVKLEQVDDKLEETREEVI